ncbi:TPA: fimbria/pilus outer membrane usher protein [Providencia alcalifaciens]
MVKLKKIADLCNKSIVFFLALTSTEAPAYKKMLFNPDFLRFSDGNNTTNFDLSLFENEGNQIPGSYLVNIYVNGIFVDKKNINFSLSDKKTLTACISDNDLTHWGVKKIKGEIDLCNNSLDKYIPYSKESVDISNQRYDITVPQQWLLKNTWKSSPLLWDEGIPAILLNYTYSGFKQENEENNFLALDGSINFLGWRLRNQSNYSSNSGWQYLNTYVQKDYTWGSGGVFTAGETSLTNSLIDNFSFAGLKLESDDDMLSPSLTEYGPVIRGVANTDATIYVKQHGSIIYQKNVPAGPFSFKSPISYGDVNIEIHEANGNIKKYTQSFAILPIFQAEGHTRYSFSMGSFRDNNVIYTKDKFINASISSGLSNDWTIYGESLIAKNYLHGTLGVGKYIPKIGGLAADLSLSKANVEDDNTHINNKYSSLYHISYTKNFSLTETSIIFSGYYYPNSRFYTFTDTINKYQFNRNKENNTDTKFQMSINQSLGDFGSLSLHTDYDNNHNHNLMATLNKNIDSAYVSLTFNKNKNTYQDDKSIFLSASLPITHKNHIGAISAVNLTSYQNSTLSTQFGLSGVTENKKLHWNITQGAHDNFNDHQSYASLTWNGNKTKISLGYSSNNDYQRWSYSASGGLAMHSSGITLGHQLSFNGANALISTSGISDIAIKNKMTSTDFLGNAIISNLSPYQTNNISLDLDNIPNNIDLNNTDKQITPRKGALVKLNFDATKGERALITLRNKGKLIPTGAKVMLNKKEISNLFFVGNKGVVYMNQLPKEGELKVKWNNGECVSPFKLDSEKLNNIELNCD